MESAAVRRTLRPCCALGWLAALLAGGLPGGCASSSGVGSEAGSDAPSTAMQHPTLEGIPVPAGFSLVPERSFGWKSGDLRTANCEFTGSLDPASVTSFYRQNMPAAGFTLQQERFDRGEYILEFAGRTERSTVRTRRENFKTVLVIDVSPTPHGSVQPELKPPGGRP
jgi:hypothetical protein